MSRGPGEYPDAMWDTVFVHKDRTAELHASFLASLPAARARLRKRLAGVSAVDLDGSVGSLTPFTRWYMEEIKRVKADPVEGLPAWWNPETPTAEDGDPDTYPFTRSQLALIDEVQAYLAAVLESARPDAEWVTFKGGKVNIDNGRSMLKFGKKRFLSPKTVAYGVALRVDFSHQAIEPEAVEDLAREVIADWR